MHNGSVPTLRDLLNRRHSGRRFSGAATTSTTRPRSVS
ncbi:hypothetical protein [Candidatus Accumulibacter sp. ACC007]